MDTTVSADAPINKNLFICRGGQLQLTTTVLDFSTITLGSPQSMNVTINNQSCAELNVSSISVPSPFRLVNPIGSFTLAGNGLRVVTVEFNPTQHVSDPHLEYGDAPPATPTGSRCNGAQPHKQKAGDPAEPSLYSPWGHPKTLFSRVSVEVDA